MKVKICPSCRAKFECEENSHCWCHRLPAVTVNSTNEDCICPKCLEVRKNG